jgi:hypothetical protein
VYILTAGGGGKEYARAMSKLGCKAFVVEGGLKGWAAAGLRTKPTYTVSVADVIKEEAQQLAAPLLQCVAHHPTLSLSLSPHSFSYRAWQHLVNGLARLRVGALDHHGIGRLRHGRQLGLELVAQ